MSKANSFTYLHFHYHSLWLWQWPPPPHCSALPSTSTRASSIVPSLSCASDLDLSSRFFLSVYKHIFLLKKKAHIPQLCLFLKLISLPYFDYQNCQRNSVYTVSLFPQLPFIPLIKYIDWFLILSNISNWVPYKNCKTDKKEKYILKIPIISPPRDKHSWYLDVYIFHQYLRIHKYMHICWAYLFLEPASKMVSNDSYPPGIHTLV